MLFVALGSCAVSNAAAFSLALVEECKEGREGGRVRETEGRVRERGRQKKNEE